MNYSHEDLEYLNGILSRINDLIARCDQKISITIALLSGFLALFFSTESSCLCQPEKASECTPEGLLISTVLFWVALGISIVALILLTYALSAKFRSTQNIEFFSCIKQNDLERLMKRFKNYSEKEKFQAIIEQIYTNYKISYRKHICFNWGLVFSVVGIIVMLVSSIL